MKSKGGGIGDSGSHEMVTRLSLALFYNLVSRIYLAKGWHSRKVGGWIPLCASPDTVCQSLRGNSLLPPSIPRSQEIGNLEQELPKISWAHFATESSGELREEVGRATWRDESLTSPLFTSKLVVDGPNRQFQISPGHAPLRRPVHWFRL